MRDTHYQSFDEVISNTCLLRGLVNVLPVREQMQLQRRPSVTCCRWCTRTLSAGRTRFKHTPVWAGWEHNCSRLQLPCSAVKEHLCRCMSARSTATGELTQQRWNIWLFYMFLMLVMSLCAPIFNDVVLYNIKCRSTWFITHAPQTPLCSIRYIFALNMFELGCITATEWAVYQDWHSLLVEQFGHRVELEGIIYLRASPQVWTDVLHSS